MPPAEIREQFATFAQLERTLGQRDWLSDEEQERRRGFRSQRRRASWTFGRMLAKRLLLDHDDFPDVAPNEITIVSHNAFAMGTQPRVMVDGVVLPVCVSISHTDRAAIAAISSDPIGVDLVDEETPDFTTAAMRLWFTRNELKRIAQSPRLTAKQFWAVKEAAFKVGKHGKRFTPKQIEVRPITDTLFLAQSDLQSCRVTLQQYNGHLAATARSESMSQGRVAGVDQRKPPANAPTLLPTRAIETFAGGSAGGFASAATPATPH